MKQLTDSDISNMIGESWIPDNRDVKNSVRRELKLSKKIPGARPTQTHVTLDFHQHTEEEAWAMLMAAIANKAHTATVITGASGILKIKFQQWARDSLLSPHIVECTPINNGSFRVKFKKL